MFFFFICKVSDWSLNSRFISRDFFNNKFDRLSRKQRLKVKTCPNKITLVLENMSDGHQHIKKLDFRLFFLNWKLVKICSYSFRKMILFLSLLFSSKRSTYFLTGPKVYCQTAIRELDNKIN